jgi:5-methylcytosine-specific restriction protein A
MADCRIICTVIANWVRRFYLSAAWLRKRAAILERDNYECQKHKRQGKFKKATCVHHKLHLKNRPDLALVDSNLESLCDTCHNEEHPEKLHSNTKKRFINIEQW